MGLRTIFLEAHTHVFRSRSDRGWLAAIVVAGAYVYYANLGAASFRTWDEGLYAAAARTAVEQGHWLLPYLHWGTEFQPFLEKPPLAIWLEAFSMLLFGTNEFAARFPSATATILTAALLYIVGRDLFGRLSGVGAATVFLTIPYLYAAMNGGRDGGTDMVFVFFGTLMAYLLWRYTRTREQRPALLYAATGTAVLAILTKGFAFGTFALVVLPLVICRWRRFMRRPTAIAAVGAIVCVLAWPVYAYLQVGPNLIDELFIEQVLERASGGPDPTALLPGMTYPYIKESADALDPWLYALPFAISVGAVRTLRSRVRAEGWRVAWLVWWGISVVALFAFTGDHYWYIIPAYVPTALLVGYLGGVAARGARTAQTGVVLALASILLVSGRSIHLDALSNVFINTSEPIVGSSEGLLFILTAVVVASAIFVTARGRLHDRLRSERDARAVRGAFVVVIVVLLVTPPVFASNWDRTQSEHGAVFDGRTPSDATIYR